MYYAGPGCTLPYAPPSPGQPARVRRLRKRERDLVHVMNSDIRDTHLLSSVLLAVPPEAFKGILKRYISSFKDELDEQGISSEYLDFYSVSDPKRGKMPFNMACIYPIDKALSNFLTGCDKDGNEKYRQYKLEHLDDIVDTSVFAEVLGIDPGELNLEVTAPKTEELKERFYPRDPERYIVPPELRSVFPPSSSGFTDGVYDFTIRPCKLESAGDGYDEYSVMVRSDDVGRLAKAFCTTDSPAIVNGDIITFSSLDDAARAATCLKCCGRGGYARKAGRSSRSPSVSPKGPNSHSHRGGYSSGPSSRSPSPQLSTANASRSKEGSKRGGTATNRGGRGGMSVSH